MLRVAIYIHIFLVALVVKPQMDIQATAGWSFGQFGTIYFANIQ